MTEQEDDNAKLLEALVRERESKECRAWFKTPEPEVSGSTASSLEGTFRSGPGRGLPERKRK